MSKKRMVCGALVAGSLFMGMQSPVSANQVWITTDVAVGAINSGTLYDHWYQVFVEDHKSDGWCTFIEVSYTGSGGWQEVHKTNSVAVLEDCDGVGEATLLYTGTDALFFRTVTYKRAGGEDDIVSPAKAAYDDQ